MLRGVCAGRSHGAGSRPHPAPVGPRRNRVTAIATRLLVASILGIALYCTPMVAGQPTPEPVARADPNSFRAGIAYGNRLLFMPPGELASRLDDAVELGAGWIRVDLSWADVQPASADRHEWDRFDRIVDAARSRGLQVLPILTYTPPWARVPGCFDEKCAPSNPEDFARFAGEAVSRYSGISVWEIWNEENYANFWHPQPNADAYAHLLNATVASIRTANPTTRVLIGGLANVDSSQGGIRPADFLADLARVGAVANVDGVGIHYPSPDTLSSVRAVLANAGVPGLPIWITEEGAPTGGEDIDAVTESEQAEKVTHALTGTAREPDIAALIWYTDKDFGSDPNDSESHYGLRRADGSKKPAYNAFQQGVRDSRG